MKTPRERCDSALDDARRGLLDLLARKLGPCSACGQLPCRGTHMRCDVELYAFHRGQTVAQLCAEHEAKSRARRKAMLRQMWLEFAADLRLHAPDLEVSLLIGPDPATVPVSGSPPEER